MAHTFAPFSALDDLDIPEPSKRNVGRKERVGSAVAGAALAAYGVSRRDRWGVALGLLGGALLVRGSRGFCEGYALLGIDTAGGLDGRGVPGDVGIRIEHTVEIAKSPMELYHFWHTLTNLPEILPHVKSVTVEGARSHWVVAGPVGHDVHWIAEFISENPGEVLAWQSLPGSEVHNAGSVRFESLDDGASTRMKVAIEYLPPGGKLGAALAALLQASPQKQLEADLERFKARMEAV